MAFAKIMGLLLICSQILGINTLKNNIKILLQDPHSWLPWKNKKQWKLPTNEWWWNKNPWVNNSPWKNTNPWHPNKRIK